MSGPALAKGRSVTLLLLVSGSWRRRGTKGEEKEREANEVMKIIEIEVFGGRGGEG